MRRRRATRSRISSASSSSLRLWVAPAVGTILAELVTEGRCTSYDIGLFRYTRFEEGESSAGGYRYGILG